MSRTDISLYRKPASESQVGETSYSSVRTGMSSDFKDKINLIHNGSLRIAQRYGTPASVSRSVSGPTGDNSFHFDRWNCYSAGVTAKNYSFSGNADVPTYDQCGIQLSYSYRFVSTSATSTQCAAATDTLEPFVYAMEGWDYAKIHGKPITIMFWVKCSQVGTYSFYCGTTTTRTYVSTFTINAPNTWERKVINLTLDISTGSYSFDSTLGLWIGFFGYGGTDFQTATLNTWIVGKYIQYSGATSLAAGASFNIQCIQLVQGTIASTTSFDYSDCGKSWKEELEICQRYYEKSFDLPTAPATNLGAAYEVCMPSGGTRGITQSNFAVIQYMVEKRVGLAYGSTLVFYNCRAASNTLTITRTGAFYTSSSIAQEKSSTKSTSIYAVSASSTDGGVLGAWTADAEIY